MTDSLTAAVRTYRLALAAVDTTRIRSRAAADRQVEQAKARADEARAALATAIVKAAREGTKQRDIVASTGYSRERVRQICRAAGVEPAD